MLATESAVCLGIGKYLIDLIPSLDEQALHSALWLRRTNDCHVTLSESRHPCSLADLSDQQGSLLISWISSKLDILLLVRYEETRSKRTLLLMSRHVPE